MIYTRGMPANVYARHMACVVHGCHVAVVVPILITLITFVSVMLIISLLDDRCIQIVYY